MSGSAITDSLQHSGSMSVVRLFETPLQLTRHRESRQFEKMSQASNVSLTGRQKPGSPSDANLMLGVHRIPI